MHANVPEKLEAQGTVGIYTKGPPKIRHGIKLVLGPISFSIVTLFRIENNS